MHMLNTANKIRLMKVKVVAGSVAPLTKKCDVIQLRTAALERVTICVTVKFKRGNSHKYLVAAKI